MAIAIVECEYACPAQIYNGNGVREDAARNVENPAHFLPDAWEDGEIDNDEWVAKHGKAGCQLKVFNDGAELPIETIGGSRTRDITCVGPTSPLCPAAQGFSLEKILKGGVTIHLARREPTE